MSQLPQNNEAFDYNPEYAKLYQEDDSVQSDADDMDDRLLRASEPPSNVRRAQDGERAANFSLLFGALGLLSFFIGFWWSAYGIEIGILMVIVAPFLSILGLRQAFVARRHGKHAIAGMILSAVGIVVVLAILALIIMILSALSGLNDAGPSRSLNALMLYWN